MNQTRAVLLLLLRFTFSGSASAADDARAVGAPSSGLEAKVDAYLAPSVANHDFSGGVLIARGKDIMTVHRKSSFTHLLRVTALAREHDRQHYRRPDAAGPLRPPLKDHCSRDDPHGEIGNEHRQGDRGPTTMHGVCLRG